jgi:transposase
MVVEARRSRQPFELRSEVLGPLPVVNHFLGRLKLSAALDRHVPADDRRLRLAPAAALGVLVRNLVVSHRPLYAVAEWAAPYDPAMLGLAPGEVALLNDDRVGRVLERLFHADRASLLTEVVVGAVRAFGIDCAQLHNDSTTVTFSGAYRAATGAPRGGVPTPAVTFGHNKDHRPDLRQLVWILTVSADGAVPLAHRVASGNTSDDATHVPTWDELVALVGRADFLYVADCKLATRAAMEHIDDRGGRFVTVLPRSRREDGWFRDWITRNTPAWIEALRRPARRRDEPDDVCSVFESPLPTADGYRIVWVRSTAKTARDAAARVARLERATTGLEDLNRRLAGPKCRLKTKAAVDEAAHAVLAEAETTRFFEIHVREERDRTYHQEQRGLAGPHTRFRQTTRTHFALTWRIRDHVVKADAASDGCFPLVTNDPNISPAEALAAYKYQPNLERRHAQLKGTQAVAPVFLKDPARIEALLCCHFLALLVHALIERQIRTAMADAAAKTIPLYPEDRDCPAPSAARILEIFNGVTRHHLLSGGTEIEVFEPNLTALQRQVLRLLAIPAAAYQR